MKINRQAEDAARDACFYSIDERAKLAESIHVLPNAGVIGVEDMGAIDMDHYSRCRISLRVAVAPYVLPLIKNKYLAWKIRREFPCENSSGKSGSDNQKTVRFGHVIDGYSNC